MKKFLTGLCACAMIASASVGVAACGCKKEDGTLSARDVYALSAVASVDYLKHFEGGDAGVQAMSLVSRPSSLTDTNIAGIKDSLSLFDTIIQGGGVDQKVEKNASSDETLKDYNFVMTITVPVANETFKMYYDELETETKREIEDEKEEVKVSTTLSGVMIAGDVRYEILGKREVETEGDENEATIEFTTKSKTNPDNYIKVSQSIETEQGETEIEYEYKIYRGGECVQDIEVEFEDENGEFELEFQIKDRSTGTTEKTKYEIKKSGENFVVEYLVDGNSDTITVSVTDAGYVFTYSNGATENISF